MKVTVLPHDPRWKEEFAVVKAQLAKTLADVAIRDIVHVGSTSVADLPAKPVLDIDIIVAEEDVTAVGEALTSAGYLPLGELGVPGRYAFRQPGYDTEEQAGEASTPTNRDVGETPLGMRRNTYVCVDGCQSLRNHLDLKRVLETDDALRKEYGELKLRLAEGEVADIDAYCSAKNDVVLKILAKASWPKEELDEIRRINS